MRVDRGQRASVRPGTVSEGAVENAKSIDGDPHFDVEETFAI